MKHILIQRKVNKTEDSDFSYYLGGKYYICCKFVAKFLGLPWESAEDCKAVPKEIIVQLSNKAMGRGWMKVQTDGDHYWNEEDKCWLDVFNLMAWDLEELNKCEKQPIWVKIEAVKE